VRRPLGILSILNLFLPGIAQCSYGRWGRGLLLVVVEACVEAACCEILIHVPRFNLAAALGLLAIWRLWAVVDAVRIARRSHARPFLRRLAALVLAAVAGTAVLYPCLFVITRTVVEPYRMPTRSMVPTVLDMERILVDRVAYAFREPRRGEIVTYWFRDEGQDPRVWLKRVVGLPGDRVEVRGHRAIVNGTPLDEPYARLEHEDPYTADFGPVTVSEGAYFVLGDNRPRSLDSRQKGCVPGDDIFGRAGVVFASWNPETRAWQWDRIGRLLR